MLGVDYSAQSVQFARRIAESRSSSSSSSNSDSDSDSREEPITFLEHDILSSPSALLTGAQSNGWDVVLDKGTFDAISLSSTIDPATGLRINESYKSRITPLVRENGIFLVTSCNWTEEELRVWFEGEVRVEEEEEEEKKNGSNRGGWKFVEVGRVAYPSFSFGGVKGQTISSLCFRKVRISTS